MNSLFNIFYLLSRRNFLILLLIINILGTIYGYYWYGYQLEETKPIFLAFVPDSPTASLFFVFVLIAFLMKKNWPYFEALALVTLFKYGIWAVVMNLLTLIVSGDLHWTGFMLMGSHLAMAIEGILYARYYNFKWRHLAFAGIWTLHNDVIDYVFMQYPIYRVIDQFIPQIGYFTFWLSILSLYIAFYLVISKKRKQILFPHFH